MSHLSWPLAVPTGLPALLTVGFNLFDRPLSAATPIGLSPRMAVLMLAAPGWGFKLGTAEGRPGLAVAPASWFVFAITLSVNGLLHQ